MEWYYCTFLELQKRSVARTPAVEQTYYGARCIPPSPFRENGWARKAPAKIQKGGGLPRSSAEGGWYRGAAPLTIQVFLWRNSDLLKF